MMFAWYNLDKNNKPVLLNNNRLDFGGIKQYTTKKSKLVCKYRGVIGELSTVFLNLDHGHGLTKKPVLWESMIFSKYPELDGFMMRSTSHKQAIRKHNKVLRAFRKGVA